MLDEKLIELCESVISDYELSLSIVSLADGRSQTEDEMQTLQTMDLVERDRLAQISTMPSVTLAGFQAKAKVVLIISDEDLSRSLASDGLKLRSIIFG